MLNHHPIDTNHAVTLSEGRVDGMHYPRDRIAGASERIATAKRFPADRLGSWLSAIVQSSMDAVIVVDAASQIVLANSDAGALFGYGASHLVAHQLDVFLPLSPFPIHQSSLPTISNKRQASRRLCIRSEATGRHANGSTFLLEASISSVIIRGELFFPIVLRVQKDIAITALDLHYVDKKFRTRAVASQQACEVEKRRFSEVLYGDLGQSLSVLKLDMDWLQHEVISEQATAQHYVAQMQTTLDILIARTKSIASTLRPPLLDDFGLIAALQWITSDFPKKTGILCKLTTHCPAMAASGTIESAVFRLVQESLLNIERHAFASEVSIFLWQDDSTLDVLIQDDGIGLTGGSRSKPGCYGLIGMQERIYTLNGSISINNIEAKGLAIHASIPLVPH